MCNTIKLKRFIYQGFIQLETKIIITILIIIKKSTTD
jgi:hypothetical protein